MFRVDLSRKSCTVDVTVCEWIFEFDGTFFSPSSIRYGWQPARRLGETGGSVLSCRSGVDETLSFGLESIFFRLLFGAFFRDTCKAGLRRFAVAVFFIASLFRLLTFTTGLRTARRLAAGFLITFDFAATNAGTRFALFFPTVLAPLMGALLAVLRFAIFRTNCSDAHRSTDAIYLIAENHLKSNGDNTLTPLSSRVIQHGRSNETNGFSKYAICCVCVFYFCRRGLWASNPVRLLRTIYHIELRDLYRMKWVTNIWSHSHCRTLLLTESHLLEAGENSKLASSFLIKD